MKMFIVLLILLCSNSCTTFCGDVPPDYCSAHKLPLLEQIEFQNRLPPHDQVAYYLFMMDKKRPPNLGLAYALATGDVQAFEYAISRLSIEQDEFRINNILYLAEIRADRLLLTKETRMRLINMKADLRKFIKSPVDISRFEGFMSALTVSKDIKAPNL